MRKIIVTAGLAVALITSTSIAAHEHIKVEQLREDVNGLEKLMKQKEDIAVNMMVEMRAEANNYSVLNEQLELKVNLAEEKLAKANKQIEVLKAENVEKTKQVVQAKKEIKQPSRSNTGPTTKTVYVTATAYTAYCSGCSGTTATGIDLRANPGLKVIAVDPKVIPLGSKVHVEGYGYAIAGDTGGAIKGNKIDLFIPSKSKALEYGKQKGVEVKILTEK